MVTDNHKPTSRYASNPPTMISPTNIDSNDHKTSQTSVAPLLNLRPHGNTSISTRTSPTKVLHPFTPSFHSNSGEHDDTYSYRSVHSAMRSGHSKLDRTCPKVESLSWDGQRGPFRTFQNALEGHLLQIGVGYLSQPSFHQTYMYDIQAYFSSDHFFQMYEISTP